MQGRSESNKVERNPLMYMVIPAIDGDFMQKEF